jgi:hypothetical protein
LLESRDSTERVYGTIAKSSQYLKKAEQNKGKGKG